MKDIMFAPFVTEMRKTTANMYRVGWDERNGGNISYRLDEDEVLQYLQKDAVIRSIPLGFDAKEIAGKYFIVTGTGKYFKNVDDAPEMNLGIVRISADGQNAELLWGFADGGKFTSEFPAHLMSHMARLSVDPDNRVVMHCHPTYTLAMNYVHVLDEKENAGIKNLYDKIIMGYFTKYLKQWNISPYIHNNWWCIDLNPQIVDDINNNLQPLLKSNGNEEEVGRIPYAAKDKYPYIDGVQIEYISYEEIRLPEILGWYDMSYGKVYIVVDNHISI